MRMVLNATNVFGNGEAFDPKRGDDWLMYTGQQMKRYFAANGINSKGEK